MTPQEALQLLDNALAQISTTREGHSLLAKALQVLADATEKGEKDE